MVGCDVISFKSVSVDVGVWWLFAFAVPLNTAIEVETDNTHHINGEYWLNRTETMVWQIDTMSHAGSLVNLDAISWTRYERR